MKELSIEQKAKAYDEAIERAREWSETKNGYYMPKELCEEIFPKLKESEDEKIRKRLIFDFKVLGKAEWGGLEVKDIIAWLEKQGNKDTHIILPTFTFDDILALQCCMETVKKVQEDKDLYEKLKDLHGRVYDAYQLEKQGEQKPTDKVEPKFKVGDWIYHEISGNTFHINKIENDLYVSDEGATISLGRQNDWRIWTIEDAKNGDAGYTFENRSKELSLSLQIQAYLSTASDELYAKGKPLYSEKRIEDIHKCMLMWLRLHNAYFYRKSDWSDEDDAKLKSILFHIEDVENKDVIYWLKSLKERYTWKPSDEQLKALKEAVDKHFDIDGGALWHLYEDLKKLKGE